MIKTATKFEIVRSSTLQTLRLRYEHNKVTSSSAVIFVTTEVKGRYGLVPLVYKDANKQVEIYKTIFEKFLMFDSVEICRNYSK